MTTVKLVNNRICDEGAARIAAASERNRTLTIVNLADHDFGAEGADRIAAAPEKNSTLTTVNLPATPSAPRAQVASQRRCRIIAR